MTTDDRLELQAQLLQAILTRLAVSQRTLDALCEANRALLLTLARIEPLLQAPVSLRDALTETAWRNVFTRASNANPPAPDVFWPAGEGVATAFDETGTPLHPPITGIVFSDGTHLHDCPCSACRKMRKKAIYE